MAAQKTIQTLQGMMRDQKEELDLKDKRMEEMIRDGRTHKEKDSLEIQRLNNQAMRLEREKNERRIEDDQVVMPSNRGQALQDL